MSSYNELIKKFEKSRGYIRDFYIYGLKSREEYNRKSLRTYDDERRRIESWLGDYMGFTRTVDGKNMFISIDSRNVCSNPLYKAFKTKSFTDIDITLHFILFDILDDSSKELTLSEIIDEYYEYLSCFESPIVIDESTVRKKLKEYESIGVISSRKDGRKTLYRRGEGIILPESSSALEYFSEILPCGVIGSFILDKYPEKKECISFKHHYILQALDSEVLTALFLAMREKRIVFLEYHGRHSANLTKQYRLIPLKIYVSTQNGRQHLLAYNPLSGDVKVYRIDYISNVTYGEVCEDYDEQRERIKTLEKHIWGVGCKNSVKKTEHVEFTVYVGSGEEYIAKRLYREKRVGTVERLDEHTYRFSCDIFDTYEIVPWIRTFLCRITSLRFSNRTVENQFRRDLEVMYKRYGIKSGKARGETE